MENTNKESDVIASQNQNYQHQKRNRIIIIILAVLLIIAIALSLFFGISSAMAGGPGDQTNSKLRLKISSENNLTRINRGETLQLAATVMDHETEEELDHEITWEALNPEIATIDDTGLLTSALHGNATFKAVSNEDIKLFDTFTVVIIADTSVTISSLNNVASIYENETLQLSAVVTHNDESPVSQIVAWTLDQPQLASIDATGLLTAYHYGEVTVTATASDGSYAFGTFVLTIESGVTIEISSPNNTREIIEGQELQLTATVLRTSLEPIPQDVTWESSDPAIATIDEHGLVSSLSYGEVILQVTTIAAPFVRDTFVLNILPRATVSITNSDGVNSIIAGKSLDFVAIVQKSDGSPISQEVIWTVSDDDIASIDQSGYLESKTPGDVVIKATSITDSLVFDTFELHVEVGTIVQISTPDNVTTLIEGQTLQLSVLVSKVGDPDVSQDVDWGVNTFTLASITNDGLLTAAHYGDVVVGATTTDGSGAYATITIHIEALTIVEVHSENLVDTIQEDDTLQLEASINKADTHEIAQDVVWHSSDNTIATVDQNGLVTAHSYGDVTIVATQIGGQGAQGEFALHIDAHVVITITGDNPRIVYMGENISLSAIVSAPDGRPVSQNINWQSSNPGIASINGQGVITPVAVGEVSVTATSADGLIGAGNEAAKATINIRVVEPRNGIIYRETPDGTGQIVVGLVPNQFNRNLVIPSVFDGKPVVEIGAQAFSGENRLISCIIPDSVKYLGFGAFNIALIDNTFTTCVIGNGVTEIADSCFMAATELVNITFGNSITTIGANAFQYCSALEEVVLPESLIWLKSSVFFNCASLHSVILPRSLEHLGSMVFTSCYALLEIYMPATILVTGNGLFADSPTVINCEPDSLPALWGSEGKHPSRTWDGSVGAPHTINWGVPLPE